MRASEGPKGVGGWLLLLVVGMSVLGPLLRIGRFYAEAAYLESSFPGITDAANYKTYKTLAFLTLSVSSAFSAGGGIYLWFGKTPEAPLMAKRILWGVGPGATLLMTLAAVLTLDSTPDVWAQGVMDMITASIAAWVWTAYLDKSERVKNTYASSVVGVGHVNQADAPAAPMTPSSDRLLPSKISLAPPTPSIEPAVAQVIHSDHSADDRPRSHDPGQNVAGTAAEEAMWAEAMTECDGPGRREGVWARAFAKARGAEKLTRAYYIEWRVDQMKADAAAESVAQLARITDASQKQTQKDAEQGRLREAVDRDQISEETYSAFVALAQKFTSFGLSSEHVQEQLERRGLPKDLAIQAADEARK